MSNADNTPYELIFASLKHPIRRRISRLLSKQPMSFSEMLTALDVSSSFLTYHLENLGELILKTDKGKYRLSSLGEATIATMVKVEDVPSTLLKQSIYSSGMHAFVKKTGKRFLIYTLSFVLIIALFTTTAVLYLSTQSLRRESENNRLGELNFLSEDVEHEIEMYVSEYYHLFTSNLGTAFNYTPQADNVSKLQAVLDIQSALVLCADDVYPSVWNDINQIEAINAQANGTAYENISETVRVALGQVQNFGIGLSQNELETELPQLMGQLFYIIGIDRVTDYPNSGLRGIAWSFLSLSDAWNSDRAQTFLSFALRNATALYTRLTTWPNYTRTDLNQWS